FFASDFYGNKCRPYDGNRSFPGNPKYFHIGNSSESCTQLYADQTPQFRACGSVRCDHALLCHNQHHQFNHPAWKIWNQTFYIQLYKTCFRLNSYRPDYIHYCQGAPPLLMDASSVFDSFYGGVSFVTNIIARSFSAKYVNV